MTVEKTFDVSAPFLVYANVTEWNEIELASNIKSIKDIEKLVDEKTTEFKRPFAFKLTGENFKSNYSYSKFTARNKSFITKRSSSRTNQLQTER